MEGGVVAGAVEGADIAGAKEGEARTAWVGADRGIEKPKTIVVATIAWIVKKAKSGLIEAIPESNKH